MSFLSLETKMLILPRVDQTIRNFFLTPSGRHLYNCMITNFGTSLEPQQVALLEKLKLTTDYHEARKLVAEVRYSKFLSPHVPGYDTLEHGDKSIWDLPD